MMNEYTGSDVTTKIHEEKWLGDLQATSGKRRRRQQRRLAGAAERRLRGRDQGERRWVGQLW